MMEWIIKNTSSYGGEIDWLIIFVAILGGFWFIIAQAVFFYFIFRFHKSRSPKAAYITGEKKEEKKWIHIPHNLILLCDVAIIVFAIKVWYQVKQDLPPAEETVRVIAQQWAWRFVHPGPDHQLGTDDDITTVDQLHVKVGTTYHYKLESIDVLHSFSIPTFRLKQDAIPGREITGWFKATETGTHDIQCAEICGIGHGLMPARIYVETEEEHQKWMATAPHFKV